MTSPAQPIDLLPAAAQAARLEAENLWARRTRLGGWHTHRGEDGTITLSAEVHTRFGPRVLPEFAASACVYFEGRPSRPGDQGPHLDVSVPGREACVWRTGGVWVELWHPIPATPPTAPVRPVPGPPKARGLLGGRLPVGRRRKTSTA